MASLIGANSRITWHSQNPKKLRGVEGLDRMIAPFIKAVQVGAVEIYNELMLAGSPVRLNATAPV
jgi:hypothetical protein